MPRTERRLRRRRAAILMVTVVLLTLFLVVGLCFVLFADAQSTSSRLYRESDRPDPYPTPQQLLEYGLGGIIYDHPDDESGWFSAIRGHSLARNMYGWNYDQPDPANPQLLRGLNNETPFNGVGRLSYTNALGVDDRTMLNYTYFAADGFIRHPERYGPMTPANKGLYTGGANPPYTAADLNHVFLAQLDGNGNILLPSYWRGDQVNFRHNWAAPQPTLHPDNKAWTDPTAPGVLKYMTLRPRPVDQLTPTELAGTNEASVRAMANNKLIFPLPKAYTDPATGRTYLGDVQNLPGAGLNYDAVWMDLGYRPFRLPGGRKVKPMFAITIVDMDGRVNLNVAGNTKEGIELGAGREYHGSVFGFGPWEINPRQLLVQAPNPPGGSTEDYLNLFRGTTDASGNRVFGRFGWALPTTVPPQPPYPETVVPRFPQPTAARTSLSVPGHMPPHYADVDWDGSSLYYDPMTMTTVTTGPTRLVLPGTPGRDYSIFPGFPKHYHVYGNNWNDERYAHPSLFNPFRLNQLPYTDPSTGMIAPLPPDEVDQMLPIGDMRRLIAWTTPRPSGAPLPTNPFNLSPELFESRLGKLWPNNIRLYPRLANLVTTHSMDLDRAGCAPGQPLNPPPAFGTASSSYQMTAAGVPAGPTTVFNDGTPASLLPNRPTAPAPGGDLFTDDWRSALAWLGRIDLNRPLVRYPEVNPATGQSLDMSNPANRPDAIRLWRADRDRVLLARDIFDRLRYATGAYDLDADPLSFRTAAATANGNPQFEALRYLAQLAVNIVDYVDYDDVNTAFNFLGNQITREPPLAGPYPAPALDVPAVPGHGWVYGTELPRLVVNEVYAQANNHPLDPFTPANKPYAPGGDSDPDSVPPSPNLQLNGKATMPYRINYFVELFNPSEISDARLQFTNGAPGSRGVYRLIIRSKFAPVPGVPDPMRAPSNVRGDPATAPDATDLQITEFASDATVPMGLDTNVVKPSFGSYTGTSGSNQGYYVLGPASQVSPGVPNWQAEFPRNRGAGMQPAPFTPTISVADAGKNKMYMQLPLESMGGVSPDTILTDPTYRPSVFLQRLVNPNLPFQNEPTQPFYNPYITVDYVNDVPIQDAVLYDANLPRQDPVTMLPKRTEVDKRFSVGRRQPFKASVLTPQAPQLAVVGSAQQTFFRQNGQNTPPLPPATPDPMLDRPFTWLVHLDRQLSSPAELLHTHAWKPHLLTQEFMKPVPPPGAATPADHLAPWRLAQHPVTGQSIRLYRALELLGVKSFMHGASAGGRVPGKININTIPDNPSDPYNEVFRALCDALPAPQGRHFFDQATVDAAWAQVRNLRAQAPIMGTAVPFAPAGTDQQFLPWDGPERTMLRGNLLPATGDPTNHPYNTEELLKKVFANVTTRSNVFAVYITVGFFSVRDESVRPERLGAEVAGAPRYKFFAVVDRTNLTLDSNNLREQGARPIFFPLTPVDAALAAAIPPADPNYQAFAFPNAILAGTAQAETLVPAHEVRIDASGRPVLVVRDTIDHKDREYSAQPEESGAFVPIREGSRLYLGVGRQMELVEVVPGGITITPGDPTQSRVVFRAIDPGTGAPLPTGFQFNHARGDSFCTQRLGNPGPRPGIAIELTDPRYRQTVVPYVIQLQ